MVQAGVPLTALAVSPLTNSVMVAVSAGLAAPNSRDALMAVTVRVAGFTVSVAVAMSSKT